MNFYIVSIPFKQYVPDPMQRAIVYVEMTKWCEENVELRNQVKSTRFWFIRAYRGRTGIYKFHFRNEQDYHNFINKFGLEKYI
jgi:hypothetical protein